MTTHHPTAGATGRSEADEALITRLVEQIDRTYETQGRASALQSITEMLRRLDPASLHVLGLQREVEAEELEREA